MNNLIYCKPEIVFEAIEKEWAIIDVRSPAEYKQGHIPSAVNLPLFNNEERAIVGTAYKKESKERAIELGLEICGPKLADFYKFIKENIESKEILVHCWRGGMRSASMAWLIQFLGREVKVLEGGYKAYRNYITNKLVDVKLKICILGGKTGSGKTQILNELRLLGAQIIDLEKIANHKGSAFGWIGRSKEVGTEEFENLLWEEIRNLDLSKVVWIENESRGIGIAQIPENIFEQMRNARLYHIELRMEDRLNILVNTYCLNNMNELRVSFEKIRKRLGHEKTDQALKLLVENKYKEAASIALEYYDKTYDYSMTKREASKTHLFKFDEYHPEEIARNLIASKNKI